MERNATEVRGAGRRQRRKDARPGEIVAAAIDVFAESGFGAAKMEEIARRAGVSKGTLFVYFPTKQDLFRAVAQIMLSANLGRLESVVIENDRPLRELIPLLLGQAAAAAEDRRFPVIIRLLIAESRSFPDLARVWHDEVVAKVLMIVTAAIERAQARGEVRAGDARLFAFSLAGPMIAGVIFREVFGATGVALPDLRALAAQHAQTVLLGMLEPDR
ncbi:MAG TPA: TetR/AcrR family transcriptional regulator [Caulobacteraceae bacterium]|jgi:AcrR family transcriptional regulator